MSRSALACTAVSTPSATTDMFIVRPSAMTARAMAVSSKLFGSALTKLRSIFRVCRLKRLR